MSDLEFVGKITPKPFISMKKEEEMRIEELKKKILKDKSKGKSTKEDDSDPELTYERDEY